LANTSSETAITFEFSGDKNPPLSALVNKSPDLGLFSVKGLFGDTKGTPAKFKFMSKKYRLSKIYRGKSGNVQEKWFVFYFFINPLNIKYQRFKVYEGINYLNNLEDKEAYAKELSGEIDKQLMHGYDPFLVENLTQDLILQKQAQKIISEQNEDPLLTEAFIQFLNQKESKQRSKQTMQSYRSYIAKFEAYLIEKKIADIKVSQLTTEFITQLMQWIEIEYKIGGTTYNNHVNFWVTLINWFEKKPRQWLERKSFDFGTDTDLENKTENPLKHHYFSGSAMEKVKKAMEKYPELLYYSKFIYYSCMRPDEIRNLKIENIDLTDRIIKIVGKTGNRVVPICDELAHMIIERNIDNYNMQFYLIGKDGNVNKSMHSENFFARVFRDTIRKKAGLSEAYTLYGFKHSRVIHLLQAGYKDSEVMQVTGHRDTSSYDKYKRDLMGNIDSKLKGKTVVF
jgi:integrase